MPRVHTQEQVASVLRDAAARRFSARSSAPIADGAVRAPLPLETVLELLDACTLTSDCRVLAVGFGSRFLCSVLSRLVATVHAVEDSQDHVVALRAEMVGSGVDNVQVRHDPRLDGWQKNAPFDVILVDSRSRAPVKRLRTQLALGGRLLRLAVGERSGARLHRMTRLGEDEYQMERLRQVRTVSDLSELLRDMSLLGEDELRRALAEAGDERRLPEYLRQHALVEESDLLVALALHHGLGYLTVERLLEGLDLEVARALPRKFLEHEGILPLKSIDGRVVLAVKDPAIDLSDIAQALRPHDVAGYLVSGTDYRRLWMAVDLMQAGVERTVDQGAAAAARPAGPATGVVVLDEEQPEQHLLGEEQEARILLESVLLEAVSRRASDIHLEHGRTEAKLRLRIDGRLHVYGSRHFSGAELVRLVNVFKVLAGMDIAERRTPQGGGIRLRVGRQNYDLRVQTQASLFGENAVIRLLPQEVAILSIEDLGFPEAQSLRYRRILESPAGMVLVVGPTGSGKSTTLYSGLRRLAEEGDRKIVTVEDPIEYSVPGVQQSQVNNAAGLTFAAAARSFLRLDPDVMLIGEIRDGETAREAIRASQTGHLVLSTLHCNESTDAVQRLQDLGQDAPSLATELLAVLAQRLARRICRSCRVETMPDPDLLEEVFPGGPPAGFQTFRGRGCSRCQGVGTLGRVAVVELLPIDDELRRSIAARETAHDLRQLALRHGLHTLRDRALELVGQGVVPLSDLPRFLSIHRMAPER